MYVQHYHYPWPWRDDGSQVTTEVSKVYVGFTAWAELRECRTEVTGLPGHNKRGFCR